MSGEGKFDCNDLKKRLILIGVRTLTPEMRQKISLFGLPCYDYTVHNEYQNERVVCLADKKNINKNGC